MHRFSGLLLLMTVLMSPKAVISQTAAGPNLSGTWKLSAAKSKLPKKSQIQSEILVIRQDGSEIEFRYDTDGENSVHHYTTDKKEKAILEVPAAGSKIVAKTYWKGPMLIVETRTVFSASSPLGVYEMMHTKGSWTLSSDGLVLTEKFVSDEGQSVSVFEKQ